MEGEREEISVGDLDSSLQLLAKKDDNNARDRAARLIRVELRGVEQACDSSRPLECPNQFN